MSAVKHSESMAMDVSCLMCVCIHMHLSIFASCWMWCMKRFICCVGLTCWFVNIFLLMKFRYVCGVMSSCCASEPSCSMYTVIGRCNSACLLSFLFGWYTAASLASVSTSSFSVIPMCECTLCIISVLLAM